MHPIIPKYLILLFFILCCSSIVAQTHFFYPSNQHTLAIEQQNTPVVIPTTLLQYYTDSSNELSFQEITSPSYRKVFGKHFSWSSNTTLWVKFSLFNRSNQNGTWVLQMGEIDHMSIFLHREQGQLSTIQTGLFSSKPTQSTQYGYPTDITIDLPKNKAVTIYLAIHQHTLPFPEFDWNLLPKLQKENALMAFQNNQSFIFYGIVGFVTILIIALWIKKKTAILPLIVGTCALFFYLKLLIQHDYSYDVQLMGTNILVQMVLISFFLFLVSFVFQPFSWTPSVLYFSFRVLAMIVIWVYTLYTESSSFNRNWFNYAMLASVISDILFSFYLLNRYQITKRSLLYISCCLLFLPWIWHFLALPHSIYILEISYIIGLTSCLVHFFIPQRPKLSH